MPPAAAEWLKKVEDDIKEGEAVPELRAMEPIEREGEWRGGATRGFTKCGNAIDGYDDNRRRRRLTE